MVQAVHRLWLSVVALALGASLPGCIQESGPELDWEGVARYPDDAHWDPVTKALTVSVRGTILSYGIDGSTLDAALYPTSCSAQTQWTGQVSRFARTFEHDPEQQERTATEFTLALKAELDQEFSVAVHVTADGGNAASGSCGGAEVRADFAVQDRK